ncbi:MAG: hypothetical protein KDA93_06080 [Planctomycetaceae bacterium]|nr:hypothetical protein [Planctomycetaceae bacterium]
MITDSAKSLLDVVSHPESSEDSIQESTRKYLDEVGHSSLSEIADSMVILADGFRLNDPARAGHVGLVCGALIERGYDPERVVTPLIDYLRELLQKSTALSEACIAQFPKDVQEDVALDEVFAEIREQMAKEMPAETMAWKALEVMWKPGISLLSVSPESRKRAQDLSQWSSRIAEYHEGGHWLTLMLSVLDNEPLLVIEPATQMGIVCRMSGVTDNFQLNVLIMDAFPKRRFFSRRRVSSSAVSIARGEGPQQSSEILYGKWNLYSWRALATDNSLPNPDDPTSRTNWIWNEGIPSDIPVFDGFRVVLLGPLSYMRMWPSQRTFARLNARLTVDEVLAKEDVASWLQRMMEQKTHA